MHFCFIGQYSPEAVSAMIDHPEVNRHEATKKLIEAAGAKLISMYNMPAEGPGVLVIFDAPDPETAAAIVGVIVSTGAAKAIKLMNLFTADEVAKVRRKGAQIRAAYAPPNKG